MLFCFCQHIIQFWPWCHFLGEQRPVKHSCFFEQQKTFSPHIQCSCCFCVVVTDQSKIISLWNKMANFLLQHLINILYANFHHVKDWVWASHLQGQELFPVVLITWGFGLMEKKVFCLPRQRQWRIQRGFAQYWFRFKYSVTVYNNVWPCVKYICSRKLVTFTPRTL